MGLLFFLLGLLVLFAWYIRNHSNPYKLVFIFGKKGAGKSLLLVYYMLRYRKKGWHIYTDMKDCNIPDVRIIDVKDLASFRPEPHSVLFLDEVGISFDNRDFKSFPPGLRDFFKYQRKMQCACFMNSQAFDVDKKIRDCTDSMILQIALGNVISLSRPIIRTVTLTQPSSQADSRIADSLRFASIFHWRVLWMPKYYKYFNSKEMPYRDEIPYRLNDKTIPVTTWIDELGGFVYELHRKAADYFER